MNEIESFNPRHILCPIDFSDLSDLALKYAAAGARVYNSKLTILHAERFELPRYFSRTETEQLAREISTAKSRVKEGLAEHVAKILGREATKMDITFEVAEAHPIEAVLQTADNRSAELIVLGTHGLGGVKRLVMGSVAENVVRHSKIPVFTVRQKAHEFIDITRTDVTPRLERILCPCEVNELGRLTLTRAVSLAEHFRAKLTVLYSDEFQKDVKLSEIKEALCNWISATVKSACDLEPMVRKGYAADQIVTAAKEGKNDLIVIGAHHRQFHDAMVLGRTTDLVVRHAPAPVLVIPSFEDNRP